jgi:hypothetical protein
MASNFLNFGPVLDAIFADAKKDLQQHGDMMAVEQQILAAVAVVAAAMDDQVGLIKADVQLLSDKLDKILAWALPPEAETGDLNLPSAILTPTTLQE